jgi:hypothetical protein
VVITRILYGSLEKIIKCDHLVYFSILSSGVTIVSIDMNKAREVLALTY